MAHPLAQRAAHWRQAMRRAVAAATPHETKRERQRRQAEAAVLAGLLAEVQQWRGQWKETRGAGARRAAVWAMALAIGSVITEPLTALYREVWSDELPDEEIPGSAWESVLDSTALAVWAFSSTTQRRLEDATLDLTEVQRDAEARAQMFAVTETVRIARAVARDVAVLQGRTTGVWRTTSLQPCAFCAVLDGEAFPIDGEPLFHLGDVLQSTDGQAFTVDYADVHHPPLHPNCACELDYN